jgi:dipeptidase
MVMEKGCYMVAAGKEASTDGSVMVGRSADALGDYAQQVRAVPRKRHSPDELMRFIEPKDVMIPQVPETFAYVAVLGVLEGEDISVANGGINEFQVCAGASTGGFLNKETQTINPRWKTSLGDYRCTLVLERCKTAREGIQLIADLTEKYGARTDNYIVADPSEAWFYEEYQGNLWAAVKVPDDCFVVQANSVRIDYDAFSDKENFMGSKNLVSFAVEHGLYDPKSSEPFSPSNVYGAQTGKVRHGIPAPEYDRRRIWRGISLLAPSTNLDPEEPTWHYPLFVKPDSKLRPKDILAIFNDHYNDTKYDPYLENQCYYKSTMDAERARAPESTRWSKFHINEKRQYQYSPVWGNERIIGTPRAVTTWCAQLRNWLPNPIGGIIWMGMSEGATGPHIPWYSGIIKTPEQFTIGIQKEGQIASEPFKGSVYDDKSAYWQFRVVTNLVNLFYTCTKDEVIPVWREWEEKHYLLQPTIEKSALELYRLDPKLTIDFLTSYSCGKANEALEITNTMIMRLNTIIAHYNAPI